MVEVVPSPEPEPYIDDSSSSASHMGETEVYDEEEGGIEDEIED